jgi:chromosome segregation ATPase
MLDIQASIEKLNIASADKERLKGEIDQLNREQGELQGRIQEIEEELENEAHKKRQLERDINELSLQINSQKAAGSKEESQRVGWLREELAKKQMEIQSAQRQYKELLEQKFEGAHVSPSKTAARGPSADLNVMKLEHDMKQIKEMLLQFQTQKGHAAKPLSRLLEELEDKENSGNLMMVGDDSAALREHVKQEKAELKELQSILEDDKRRYREDKQRVEELRLTDPALYRQRSQVMERVKQSIEKRIDELNTRIAKLKQAEKRI